MVLAVVSVRPVVAALITLLALLDSTTVPAPFNVTLLPMVSVLPVSVMLPLFVMTPSMVVVVPPFTA